MCIRDRYESWKEWFNRKIEEDNSEFKVMILAFGMTFITMLSFVQEICAEYFVNRPVVRFEEGVQNGPINNQDDQVQGGAHAINEENDL